jgi:hypothetical protein
MRKLLLAVVLSAAAVVAAVAFQVTDCPAGAVCLGSANSAPVYFIQDGIRRGEIAATGLLVQPGALSGSKATSCGVLDSSTTSAQTGADTNPTDLYTYTVKPSTITTNGRGIEIIASGTFGATANTKNLFVVFGGTAVVSRASTSNAGGWQLTGMFTRNAATTYIGRGTAITDTSAFSAVTAQQAGTWAGNLDVVIRGANGVAAAGDIVFQSAVVRCF